MMRPCFPARATSQQSRKIKTTNAGNLVSSLFSSTDVDTGAVNSIALYSQTPSNGITFRQYSTDGGSTWNGVGAVSGFVGPALALDRLPALASCPMRITRTPLRSVFYVWDQTSGSTGTKVDVSTRGTTTAFSTTGGTSSITVTAVNDAPVFVSASNFTTFITEDQND